MLSWNRYLHADVFLSCMQCTCDPGKSAAFNLICINAPPTFNTEKHRHNSFYFFHLCQLVVITIEYDFSILFQKQFTIYTNKSGGNGRLRSLFSMLGIDPTADNIDYGVVCKRLDEQRTKSYSFLKQALQ